MPPPIETLQLIDWTTLEDFLEKLNWNFAVVQNSPHFKGIPGKPGIPGEEGFDGMRGSKFIFVDYVKFNDEFPGELLSPSSITMSFINSKLLTFDNKTKLLTALNIDSLIDKDVIVLADTRMLSFDLTSGLFIDTNIAFNTELGLFTNIEEIIETHIDTYLTPIIASIKNIYIDYETLGKNYSDLSTSGVTTALSSTSVYSPVIPGFTPALGIPVNNHKYIGYNDMIVSITDTQTTVFGNIKKYYNLLQQTIDTASIDGLSSDYAPGVNNIPALVVMQDTYNNGIMIGYKSKTNLRTFASIFKNINNELEIKSDSGKHASEFSSLTLSKDLLKFNKDGYFSNNFTVANNLTVINQLNTKHIKSGIFTEYDAYWKTEHSIVIGHTEELFGRLMLTAPIINYKQFKGNILITDATGNLSNQYKLETNYHTAPTDLGVFASTPVINSELKLITAKHYATLVSKLNSMSNYVNNNYWKKDEWETNIVPSLKLSTSFDFVEILFGNKVGSIKTLNITANNTFDNSVNKKYSNYKDLVFVTNTDGDLLKTYKIEKTTLDVSELMPGVPLNTIVYAGNDKSILTTNYYSHLANKINLLSFSIGEDYWTKPEFESGVIPMLWLKNALLVENTATFRTTLSGVAYDMLSMSGNALFLGNPSDLTTIRLQGKNVRLPEFTNNVLVTNAGGTIQNTISLESNIWSDVQLPHNVLVTASTVSSTTKIPLSSHLQWIIKKINNIVTEMGDNVWKKPDFIANIIPSLYLTNQLRVGGDILIGNPTSPNIATTGSTTNLGSLTGTSVYLNGDVYGPHVSKVLVTDSSRKIVDEYTVETSGDSATYFGDETDIEDAFWSDVTHEEPFSDTPTDSNKVLLTGRWGSYIFRTINVMRKLIFMRPTWKDMYEHLPVGSIILWSDYDRTMGVLPPGWIQCDGGVIPETSPIRNTPNLNNKDILSGSEWGVQGTNKFFGAVGGGSPGTLTGVNSQMLTNDNIPNHTHPGIVSPDGAHLHDIAKDLIIGWITENTYKADRAVQIHRLTGGEPIHALYGPPGSGSSITPTLASFGGALRPIAFAEGGGSSGGTSISGFLSTGLSIKSNLFNTNVGGEHSHTVAINNQTRVGGWSQVGVPITPRRMRIMYIMKYKHIDYPE